MLAGLHLAQLCLAKVKILPSGVETVIEEITSMDGALDSAEEGASIAVTLKDEVMPHEEI